MRKMLLLLLIMIVPFTVKAESKYLYDVLKNEAESGGNAKVYIGEHHDSFTEEPSKKIYHWYGENDRDFVYKNNVFFANYCWQMIRTTDTGGVKLIFNGQPERVYRIKPLKKDDYIVLEYGDNYKWNESDSSWDITYTNHNDVKGFNFSYTESNDYLINVTINKSANYYGYLYFYVGNSGCE